MRKHQRLVVLICLALAAVFSVTGTVLFYQTRFSPGATLPLAVPLLFGAAFILGLFVYFYNKRKTP